MPRDDEDRLPRIERTDIVKLLRADNDSALAHALQRVLDDLGEGGNYAAHASSPTPSP